MLSRLLMLLQRSWMVCTFFLCMLEASCTDIPRYRGNHRMRSTRKPHIVFILADDLGWNDVSWNNPDVITPNLQSLASSGVILNQSYVQALCSPSRAAYLTGLYPYHTGFQKYVVAPGAAEFLPLKYTLLPEKLKERGYSTHLVGKWHLGSCRVDATPTLRGFDSFFGCYSAMIDYFTKRLPRFPVPGANITLPDAYDLREDLDVFYSPPTEYTTDLFTQRAVEVIQEHDEDTPMYLSLHYTAPHYPLQVPDRYLDFYPNVTDVARRTYLAMVTAMDEGIGDVITALKDKGIFDDTIIVFTSDNGGIPGLGGASNYPLRGGKTSYYEGGVRSPTFVHSPNFISEPGRVSEDLFHIVDWFPTFLAAAGDKVTGSGLDGQNQWAMLSRGSRGRRREFVYNIVDSSINGGSQYVMRWEQYKLIEGDAGGLIPDASRPPGGVASTCPTRPICDCELYDLKDDPTESNDLVCDKPLLVRQLYLRLNILKASQVPSLLDFPSEVVPASAPSNNNGTVNYGWC